MRLLFALTLGATLLLGACSNSEVSAGDAQSKQADIQKATEDLTGEPIGTTTQE